MGERVAGARSGRVTLLGRGRGFLFGGLGALEGGFAGGAVRCSCGGSPLVLQSSSTFVLSLGGTGVLLLKCSRGGTLGLRSTGAGYIVPRSREDSMVAAGKGSTCEEDAQPGGVQELGQRKKT